MLLVELGGYTRRSAEKDWEKKSDRDLHREIFIASLRFRVREPSRACYEAFFSWVCHTYEIVRHFSLYSSQ